MTNHKNVLLISVILFLGLLYASFFSVSEGEHAILLRLGNILTNTETGKAYVLSPGLHYKMPILTQARIFDTRLQTLDIKSSRIVTAEQKDVIVDYFVKWRIDDPVLYYTRTSGDPLQANLLLEQQLNDGLRAQFGRRTIGEVVSDDRASIMDTLAQQANEIAKRLGISVIDVRIKRIDLPSEVSTAVFERMRAERERVATEHRATGRANAEGIRANADAQATVTVATATAQAAAIRSQGDGQAAKIYADTYSQNPDFFAFLRSLQAYKAVFNKNQTNNIFVLKPEGQFFKYFNSISAAANNEKSAKK